MKSVDAYEIRYGQGFKPWHVYRHIGKLSVMIAQFATWSDAFDWIVSQAAVS